MTTEQILVECTKYLTLAEKIAYMDGVKDGMENAKTIFAPSEMSETGVEN